MLGKRAYLCLLMTCACLALIMLSSATLEGANGQISFRVVEKNSEKPVAARMHLNDSQGNPVMPPDLPFWRDHFVFDGQVTLELPPGEYTYEIEHGPECKLVKGVFQVGNDSQEMKTVEIERLVDMKQSGWWSGDLHIHRGLNDIELLMRAEDLHIGPVITWWNNRNLWKDQPLPNDLMVRFDDNRFYQLMAGEDEREGGALLYFNLNQPLNIFTSSREFPSPVEFLEQSRKHANVHVDIEKPFWWDMPVWIATEKVDSIGLCNNHMLRGGMLANEAWGKPRDPSRYPNPHGNGRWTQDIYYHLLNCGLRIPPSAGSASGVLPNPVGYNRVYVHCDGELNWDSWWKGLRAGRVVVTNGPLLNPRVNGQLPGHVFHATKGEQLTLAVKLQLTLRDPVDFLEVVKDGDVVHKVSLEDFRKADGKLPDVKFAESGWMLIRAVTSNTQTFRFGATGPYYVEIGESLRISKSSAQFFREWVAERAQRIKLDNPDQRDQVMQHHLAAAKYWQSLVDQATAE